MRDKKKLKKWLYVAAPMLWCGALYLGSNNSLGTVLAKSVATTIQTLSTITTQVDVNTVGETATDVTVPTGIEADVTTNVMVNVPTKVEGTTIVSTEGPGGEYTQEKRTMIPTEVPTETAGVVRTILPTETLAVGSTEINTVMSTLTQLVTMTETEIITDDGQSTDGVIDQVIPSESPSEIPTTTPSEVPTEVPTTTPSEVPSVVVPTTTPSEVPSVVVPTTTPSTVPSAVMESSSVKSWVPETAEEKERASYVQKGNVLLKKGNNLVSVQKVMQGPLCITAMKNALLPGEKIAYTYNIKYIAGGSANRTVYKIDEPIEISMEMPKELLKEGRTFYMMCVSENGTTFKLPATVDKDGNLTFTTQYFYAFAIIYKDA